MKYKYIRRLNRYKINSKNVIIILLSCHIIDYDVRYVMYFNKKIRFTRITL